MSAVVEAFTDALRPSQSANLPSNPASSSASAEASEQAKKEPDVASTERVLPAQSAEGEITLTTNNMGKSNTPNSDPTRVGTPRPERSSTSSNARRVSIASARPLIATYTPATRHRLVDVSYATPDEEHSDPSDSEDGNRPLVSRSRNGYYPSAQPDVSIDSKDNSNLTTMTNDSTPADLQLGPQDLPFILRRRGVVKDLNMDPRRLATDIAPFTPRYRDAASSHVVIRPDVNTPLTSTPATRPSDRVTLHTITTTTKLSTWRLEQLKHARPAKVMGGTTLRPIPTLHGPLSLPYARNPSGVDATVADETAYMSHVFGLRAAPTITLGNPNLRGARTVSGGTQSSGGTGSRSTSGSSGVLNTTGSSRNRSLLTEGSSYSSAGGTHHSRPLVVRDPNQNIGIKVRAAPVRVGEAGGLLKEPKIELNKSAEAPDLKSARTNKPSSDSQETKDDENKENIDPSSVQLKRRASETSLLEPKLGESVLGPSRSHVNLREMSTLSPIPGSPADGMGTSPLQASQKSAASPSFPGMVQAGAMIPLRSEASAGTIRLPNYVPIFFNPTTMAYEVALALPSRRSSYEDHHINTPGGVVLPPGPKTTPNHPSKADVSDNWRKKSDDFSNDQHVMDDRNAAAISSKSGEGAATQAVEGSEAATSSRVMTIDNLFEKFTHPADEDDNDESAPVAFNFPTPSNPAKRAVLKPSKSNPVSPRRTQVSVLGETTKRLNAEAPPYTPSKSSRATKKKEASPTPDKSKRKTNSRRGSTSAKGTPGAGKLLKKASTGEGPAESETEDAAPVTPASSRRVEGKAKAKLGKK
ncbi:hypothetical protein I317_01532 [Kwoniella heveanensis CBS 569]|nr:hypothetical protein I317_01532 [Kwoniella heveanensis CBS 569]